jgi:hypothetical protein
LFQVAPGEPAPEVFREVPAEALQLFIAIAGPALAALFVLHDAAAKLPISSGHHGVHGAR